MKIENGCLMDIDIDDIDSHHTLTVPEGVTEISEKLQFNCFLITKINLPNSLKKLNSNSFKECPWLESINIPNNIETIPENTFQDCVVLKNVKFSNNLKTIESNAFRDCSSLDKLVMPSSLTTIKNNAFSSCIFLKNIKFSKNLKTIGDSAFARCPNLKNINLPEGLEEIQESAFTRCNSITNIKIPNSVKSIGGKIFEDCLNLKSCTLPKNVEIFGSSIFSNCEKLKDVTLPENILEIPAKTFFFCTELKNVKIPENVKTIKTSAFEFCKSLETAELNNIETFEDYAFKSCINLETPVFGNDLTSIGSYAFADCKNFKTLTFPKNLKEIKNESFSGCTNVQEFILPQSLEKIGNNTFAYCYALKSLFIPKTVKSVKSIGLSLPYITKDDDGIFLTTSQIDNSSFQTNRLRVKPEFLITNSTYYNELFKEQQNRFIADFYTTFLSKLPQEKIDEFLKSHNFTFFKNITKKYENDVMDSDFYKFFYNLGGFSKPVEVNNKKIDYAQKVGEFVNLKLNEDFFYNYIIFRDTGSFMTSDGLKNEFTDLFLSEFDIIQQIFSRHNGFTANCYNAFEEVQKTNTSNKGRQRQLKPTIKKFVDYFNTSKFSGVSSDLKNISDTLSKYYSEQSTFLKAVDINNERIKNNTPDNILGFHLTEQDYFKNIDDYKNEISNIQNRIINNLGKIAESELSFDWLEKNDPQNFILGKLCNCCAHLEGVGFGIMRASIVHPNIQNLVIKEKDEIIAKATLYVNEKQGYGVVNTVQITGTVYKNEDLLCDKFILAIDTFAKEYNKKHQNNPLKIINVGMNLNDLEQSLKKRNSGNTKNLKSVNYEDYCLSQYAYAGDSNENQCTIWKLEPENAKTEREF